MDGAFVVFGPFSVAPGVWPLEVFSASNHLPSRWGQHSSEVVRTYEENRGLIAHGWTIKSGLSVDDVSDVEDGPTKTGSTDLARGWVANPALASVVRLGIFVVPIAASLSFGLWASRTVPPDRLGVNRWFWWLGLLLAATAVVRTLDLLLRRLGPLPMLLRLSLVFPDQTPSRFGVALRSGSIAAEKRRIDELKSGSSPLNDTDSVSVQLLELIGMLSRHDRLTRGHAERVRGYTELIAVEMGISGTALNKLRWSALLHDMGKLDVPAGILNKKGSPDAAEWQILKQHPAKAARYLAPVADWLGEWRHAADGHHEKWDGSGYPLGLKRSEIPLAGRIVAVADAYDVMTSARSYKRPLSAEVARREIAANAGSQFDPAVARAFLSLGLGDLRRVGGPVAWFASLPAMNQIPIGTVAQPVATGFVAIATVVGAIGADQLGDESAAPELVAFSEPATDPGSRESDSAEVVPTTPPDATSPEMERSEPEIGEVSVTARSSREPGEDPVSNMPPVMASQSFAIAQDVSPGPLGLYVVAEDSDGPLELQFAVLSSDHPFEIERATGELSLRTSEELDMSRVERFVVPVVVGDGEATTTVEHEVRVVGRDEPATDGLVTMTVAEGGTATIDVGDAHLGLESETLSVEAVINDGAHGTVSVLGPSRLSYRHDGSETTMDSISYSAVDGSGIRGAGQIAVVITPVNDPPTMDIATFSIDEDALAGPTGDVIEAVDVDGPSPLIYTMSPGTPFAIEPSGEIILVQPASLDHDTNPWYSLSVTASDGATTRTTDHVMLVVGANDPPQAANQAWNVSETAPSGTEVGTISVVNPDGDPFSVSIDPATNPDLDGDQIPAFAASVDAASSMVVVTIADSDDVDHDVAGQSTALELRLTDSGGAFSDTTVVITTDTRFGLSEWHDQVIFSEVEWTTTNEFVEILNIHDQPIDVSGWVIADYAWGVDPPDAASVNIVPIPNNPSGLDPGQRVVFWPGSQVDPMHAAVEIYGNGTNQPLRQSDDLWLFDQNGRVVAYMSWGDVLLQNADNEIGDRPPIVAWSLWDPAWEVELGAGPLVNFGDSIALTGLTAQMSQTSACWEPTGSDAAAAECVGALPTVSSDPGPGRNSSPGRSNFN